MFDRDCPVRKLGPRWYQPEERQRDVIARLEANRHVRAALVPKGLSDGTLDGVADQVRAPLLWDYLRENFEPAFEANGIVFWKRK